MEFLKAFESSLNFREFIFSKTRWSDGSMQIRGESRCKRASAQDTAKYHNLHQKIQLRWRCRACCVVCRDVQKGRFQLVLHNGEQLRKH